MADWTDNVERIDISMHRQYTKEPYFFAIVRYNSNGVPQTKSIKGDSLPQVYLKTRLFCEVINEKVRSNI